MKEFIEFVVKWYKESLNPCIVVSIMQIMHWSL